MRFLDRNWLKLRHWSGINNYWRLDNWRLYQDRRFYHDKLLFIRLALNRNALTLISFALIFISVDCKLPIADSNNVSIDWSIKVEHVDDCNTLALQELEVDTHVFRKTLVAECVVVDGIVLFLLDATASLPWV